MRNNNFYFNSLKKSTKDIINILGGDKSKFTPEQKEFFDWVRQKLPNSNWRVWSAKMFKRDPKGFKRFKDELEHFGGSTHIQDIGNHRFDSKIHDTWEKGIQELKNKESEYVKKLEQNQHLIKPSPTTKEIVPIDDEWGWFDLGVPYCTQEGEAMGHCGNQPSHVEGDRVLSLRRKIKVGNSVYHEPHLTFIENNGVLGEMKGRGNAKPDPKYHSHIVELLKHPNIKIIAGGGYDPENNFSFSDLNSKLQNHVLEHKPNLITDPFLIQKQNFDLEQQEKLVGHKNPHIRVAIAKNPNLHSKFYKNLINDNDEYIRKELASKPNLSIDLQQQLAEDESPLVREVIVNRYDLHPKSYEILANDENENIRAMLATKEHLTYGAQKKLSEDKNSLIRYAVAKRHDLHPDFQEKLVNDKEEIVRETISKNSKLHPKHYDKLINDESISVRINMARKPDLSLEQQEKLVNDESPLVRKAIAENPNLNTKFYEKLIKDPDKKVLIAMSTRVESQNNKTK